MAIRDIPLKRKNPDNPQIRSYNEAIRHGQKSYHVLPSEKGWKVKRIGDREAEVFDTKAEAISHGTAVVREIKGEIIIHGKNGMIEVRHSYAPEPAGRVKA